MNKTKNITNNDVLFFISTLIDDHNHIFTSTQLDSDFNWLRDTILKSVSRIETRLDEDFLSQEEIILMVLNKVQFLIVNDLKKIDTIICLHKTLMSCIDITETSIHEDLISLSKNLKEINIKNNKHHIWNLSDKNKIYENIIDFIPYLEYFSRYLKKVFWNISVDVEDIKTVLINNAINSIDKYKPDKDVHLYGYLQAVTKTAGIGYCRKFMTKNHQVTNFAQQYSMELTDDIFVNHTNINFDDILNIIESNKDVFKDIEFSILERYIRNNTIESIAKEMNISKQKVSKHFIIAKKKFKKIWEESCL